MRRRPPLRPRLRTRPVLVGLLLCAGLACPPAGRAGDAPTPAPAEPPGLAAHLEVVLAAARGPEPGEALKRLTALSRPDPWTVVEELVLRGEGEVALAFAGAYPADEAPALKAYAARRIAAPGSLEQRRAVLGDRPDVDGPETLDAAAEAALAALELPATSVLHVLRAERLGRAARQAGRRGPALEHLRAGALSAEGIGWQRRAVELWALCGALALHLGDAPQALTSAERRVALLETTPRARARITALLDLGSARLERGDHRAALKAFGSALESAQAARDTAGVASAWLGIGNAQVRRGAYEDARRAFRSAGEHFREAKDEAGTAKVLGSLSVVWCSQGDTDRGLASLQEALARAREVGLATEVARHQGNMAEVHLRRGEFRQALGYAQQAAAAFAREEAHGGEAWARQLEGASWHGQGSLDRALRLYRQALLGFERLGLVRNRAICLSSLGQLHVDLGGYSHAIAYLEQALDLARTLDDTWEQMLALMRLGSAWGDLGNARRAQRYHEEALALLKGERGGEGLVTVGINLGVDLARHGDLEGALKAFAHARQQLPTVGRPTVQAALLAENEGLVQAVLGNVGRAHELHQWALTTYERLEHHLGAARALANLALDEQRLGRPDRARRFLQRAIRSAESLHADSLRVRLLGALGRLHLDAGDARSALALSRQGAEAAGQMLRGLDQEGQALARETMSDLYDVGATAAAALDDHAELYWFLEAGRAVSLLDALGARSALRDQTLSAAARVEALAARSAEAEAARHYARLKAEGARDPARAARREVEEFKEVHSELGGRLERHVRWRTHALYPRPAALEAVQARLGPDRALVLTAVLRGQYVALVLEGQQTRFVVLGPAERVEELCATLVEDDGAGVTAGRIERLRAQVVEPLSLAPEIRRVDVAPAGALASVPLALLFGERRLRLAPSASTLMWLEEERPEPGAGVLGLGDCLYGAPGTGRGDDLYRTGVGLVPLPRTRDEVERVAGVRLLGAQASEAGLRAALAAGPARWRAVHLACHGLIDPQRPAFSALAVSGDAENDGYLTALEVMQMPVEADLVVLSACNSALGSERVGEGVLGLPRAFLLAGASQVIGALWRVDDAATEALMRAFYEAWQPADQSPGLPAAEALRVAQAKVRATKGWEHERYWAAWTLWGVE